MRQLFTVAISLMLCACALQDATGPMGPEGAPGRSCTLTQLENGVLIQCPDGTSSVVMNGVDATPNAYSILEFIRPCPDKSYEVLMRLYNREIIAHYSDGNKQYLRFIGPGNWKTTDGTNCQFTIDADMNVSW